MYIATLNFSKLRPMPGLTRGLNIYDNMSASAYFPNPPVPYADLLAGLNTLEATLTAAVNGGKDRLAQRDDALEQVIAILRPYKNYVNYIANGNRAIIGASGFDVSRPKKRITGYGAPPNMRAMPGQWPGSVKALWGGVHGNRAYEVEIAQEPENPASWQLIKRTTKNRATLTGLQPGQRYFLRVRASGPAGLGPWSQTANSRAS